MSVSATSWHGYATDHVTWSDPVCVTKSDLAARPKYSKVDASEYLDTPSVLNAKVNVLVAMMKLSKKFMVYTGAGISTAAGVGDYASRGSGSIVQREGGCNRLLLSPTLSHRLLASLASADVLQFWLQQNHDGLAQKAGFPVSKLNEIHGNWFDRNNPVIFMDGTLRKDLVESMYKWADETDLVLAIGTSLCGMHADRASELVAARHLQSNAGLGLAIINLQRTPYDDKAALRIFAKSDTVMELVQKKMKLKIDKETYSAYPLPKSYRKAAAAA